MDVITFRISSVFLLSCVFLYAKQHDYLLEIDNQYQFLNYEQLLCSSLITTSNNYEKYEDQELEELEEEIQEKLTQNQPTKSLQEINSPFFYLNDQNILQCRFPIKDYTLRTIILDDFDSFKKLRSDHLTMCFMAGGTQNEASSKARFDILLNRVHNNNPMAWLTIVNNQTKNVMGFAALGLPSSQTPGVGELIVFFEPNTQAKGLGTAMLDQCLKVFGPEVARLGREGFAEFQCFFGKPLHKIYAAIHPQNLMALKILQKSVMKQIKHLDSQEKNKYPENILSFEYSIPVSS